MSEEDYEGIPRNKIPWDPKINYEKCVACGKCIDFCHRKAFRLEEKDGKKRTVVETNRCVIFCQGCEDVCPTGAITHPSKKKTQDVIDKQKKAENLLRSRRG